MQATRAIHLFSMAYIIGQSFTIFNLGPLTQLTTAGASSGYIIEMIMLILLLLSGVAMAYFRLH